MFKLQILYYYLQFRWRQKRLFSEKGLAKNRQALAKKWRKKRLKSTFYQSFINKKLTEFPIISKTEFMENFDLINTVGISKKAALEIALKAEKSRDFLSMINGITVGLSSETTGNKGIFLANSTERVKWVAAVLNRVRDYRK